MLNPHVDIPSSEEHGELTVYSALTGHCCTEIMESNGYSGMSGVPFRYTKAVGIPLSPDLK